MVMPSVSRSAAQTQTQTTTSPVRPSISPLSSASKTLKSSPIAARDATMKPTAAQQNDEGDDSSEAGDAEIGEHRDDGSSSLSEPEDDHDEPEEEDGADDDALNEQDAAAQQLLDDDSEAETERLDQTPQKLRKHAEGTGRTPSKLNQASTADDELSEPPSPLATGAGAASSTSTVATAGQKRKRSETAESSLTSADSDLGESPRKKNHEMPSNTVDDVDEGTENAQPSTENGERGDDTPAAEEPRATPTTRGRGSQRGRARGGRKSKMQRERKEVLEEPDPPATEETAEAEDEPSEEKTARTEAEIEAKKEASSTYDDVAKQFRSFRERLTTERIASLESELKLAEASTHPEYLKQVACVDARLQKQRSEAHAFHKYKMQSITERTLGERSQRFSQYSQSVRELREDALYAIGEDWYGIQKERRQSQQDKDDAFIYKFPANKKVQLGNQAKYNQEVSILSGLAKWVGFPAAPDIHGVEGDSFEKDLKAMKISKRSHHSTAHPRPVYYPGPATTAIEQNERLAHERFIEQNAWARPQAPIHSHGTPGISHTPDWAEPSTGGHSTAKHLIRNLSGQIARTGSPYATPITQKRNPAEQNSSAGTIPVNSDGAEPPSSVLAAPPTAGRVDLLNQGSSNQTSPINFPKSRLQNQNGPELTGFRNISNLSHLSGASTIDAPQDNHDAQRHQGEGDPRDRRPEVTKSALPELAHIPSASHTVFDTSQLHRHGDGGREVYRNVGFRPQEGAFGTPAPLPPQGGPGS